jgi:hypothetical protein
VVDAPARVDSQVKVARAVETDSEARVVDPGSQVKVVLRHNPVIVHNALSVLNSFELKRVQYSGIVWFMRCRCCLLY